MNVKDMLRQASDAAKQLITLSDQTIIGILKDTAQVLRTHTEEVLAANRQDLERMDPANPKYDRLKLTEERRTRSHRLIVRGAVFESIVPEAKNMTDEEAAALLRLALTSEPAREYLKKRAESGNAE